MLHKSHKKEEALIPKLALLLLLVPAQTVLGALVWNPADSTPSPTGRSAIGQVGGFVYVFGGGPNGNAAWAYDCSTGRWVPSTPSPLGFRANWAGVPAQGRLYVLGGSDSLFPQSDVYAFLPGSGGNGTWIRRASLPRPLALPGAASLGDSAIITAGGVTSLGYATNQCFRYHISQDRWDTLTPLPQARIAGGLVAQGGKLFLLGGLDSTSLAFTSTIFQYDPATGQWQTRRTLLAPMAFNHQSIASDGRLIYLVGGGAGVSLWPGSQLVQAWNPPNDSLKWETSLPETVGVQSTCQVAYGGTSFLLTTGGFRDSVYTNKTFRAPLPVGVEQGDPSGTGTGLLPFALSIHPNPSHGPFQIRYHLPQSQTAGLAVYNAQGRLVRRFSLRPGREGVLLYDGKDGEGKSLPSGVYFLTLTTPGGIQTRPFIRLR
jgi:hypothetical protein